jgi:hypothetical protein
MLAQNTTMGAEPEPASPQETPSAAPTTFDQILKRLPRRAFDELLDKIDAEAAAAASRNVEQY